MIRCLFLVAAILAAQEWRRHPAPATPVSQVSHLSPFQPGCSAQTATDADYVHSAVEPSVAVDPRNPQHLIGVWQQDRWSNGGATGVLTGVSMDGGTTWTSSSAPFSQCTGGKFQRASDPWVTISPDGTTYQSAIGLNITNTSSPTAVLVSRSTDGGLSWRDPVTLYSPGDRPTITADPNDSRYVYATWTAVGTVSSGAAGFARSTDGGASWEPARVVFDPSGATAGPFQIVVTPDGTLIDTFILSSNSSIAIIRSTDHGATWSGPAIVAADQRIAVVDPRTQIALRLGTGWPSTAVDPVSGAIYVTWTDKRFNGGQRAGIAFTKSTDGGLTWSDPVQVNQVPAVQAFLPAIAVGVSKNLLGSRSTIAITYCDFRQATSNVSTLPTTLSQIESPDGGNTWLERAVAGPFDLLQAAHDNSGSLFIGDYQALTASGDHFVPFFVSTDTGDSKIPSSVFALPVPLESKFVWNGHVEINQHPEYVRPKKQH